LLADRPVAKLKEYLLSAVPYYLFQHIRSSSARVLHPHPEEAPCSDNKALFILTDYFMEMRENAEGTFLFSTIL
jgi:hypothetical protein